MTTKSELVYSYHVFGRLCLHELLYLIALGGAPVAQVAEYEELDAF